MYIINCKQNINYGHTVVCKIPSVRDDRVSCIQVTPMLVSLDSRASTDSPFLVPVLIKSKDSQISI